MESYIDVGELAKKLRKFMATLIYVSSFPIFGLLLGGYWILYGGVFRDIAYTPEIIASLIAAYVILIFVGVININSIVVSAVSIMRSDIGEAQIKGFGARWAISFLLPFLTAYMVLAPLYFRVDNPYKVFFNPDLIWYPALGTALILVNLLIERHGARAGVLLAKPFLVGGICILATWPLAIAIGYIAGIDKTPIAALGMMLLSYYIAFIYGLKRSMRVFEE